MRKQLYTIVLLFFSILFCQAQDTPKLGLTLSGGGAKGLAHIGVLQVLEENGIIPDFISGTSMGSIVGGLYAIGYTPQELEELATSINWEDYFNDTYPRNYRPIEERERADRYLLSFALENGKIVIPKGLIAGKKIQTLLGGITAPVHHQRDFSRFYCPFACVATDLETGEAYVFRGGPLRKAIRASMSIPTAFNPILYDDHLLADGLLVRNLPVSDVRRMGADQVIAVDVGDPLYPREELNSVLRVLEQTSSFGMATSTEEELALADQVIDPDLSGYTTLSYNAADSLIARGRAAAEVRLPELLNWADSVGITRRSAPARPPWRRDSFLIKELIIEAEDQPAELVLRQLMNIDLPQVYTISDLTHWVDLLYATGFFDLVDYELQFADGGGYALYMTGESSLNNQLRAGINYDSDVNASLLVNYTARNWLINGSVFTADARISEFPAVLLDYAVYTRYNPSIGIQLRATGQFLPGREYINNRLEDEFTFHHYETSVDLQTSVSRQWFFKLGLGAEHFSKNPRFISFAKGDAILQQWFVYGRLIRDTYDRTYFPSEGSLSRAWIRYSLGGRLREFGDAETNTPVGGNLMIGMNLHKVFPLSKRLWVDWNVDVGVSSYEQAHLLQQFYLGRQMPHSDRFAEFYGLHLTEQPATAFAFSRIQVRAELGRNNFVGLGYNLGYHYLTAGNLLDEEEGVTNPLAEGRLHGVGLELGSLTPIGPIRFTTEYNIDLDRLNFSFFAGYRF